MKIIAPNIILLLVFTLMMSTLTLAQNNKLPEPQMNSELDGPGPPPPGLVVPLDTNIFILLASGLALGIYFLTASGKKSTSIH